MPRSHIAPLALALIWLAIVVAYATPRSLRLLGPSVQIGLVLFAVLACAVAWRFRSWFQFSAVSRALLLPTFAWAVLISLAETRVIDDALIKSIGRGNSLAFATTVFLAGHLIRALLVAALLVVPLVIVYQRYAPIAALVACVPVMALRASYWSTDWKCAVTPWLAVAELAFLLMALAGLTWLASRKGLLSKLSPDQASSAMALDRPTRRYRVVAFLAALVGSFACAAGLWSVMNFGASTKRYWLLTEILFFLFALSSFVAAVALYRLRPWGRKLWMVLCGFAIAVALPEVFHDTASLFWPTWVAVTSVLFAGSLWALWRHPQKNANAP